MFTVFLADGGYDNKGNEAFYNVTIDNDRMLKISNSATESQINFRELYFKNLPEKSAD